MNKYIFLFFILILIYSSRTYCQTIVDPGIPTKRLPPEPKDSKLGIKNKNKRKYNIPKKSNPNSTKIKEILEKVNSKANISYLNSMSLNLSALKTTGSKRKHFVSEPGVIINQEFSLFKVNEEDLSTCHFWLGLRIANFSGSGMYQDHFTRFSYLYLGPSFTFRWVQSEIEEKFTLFQRAISASFGVSSLIPTEKIQSSSKESDKEFNGSSKIFFDSPGFWIELSYINFLNNIFGTHVSLGAQLGYEKIFLYTGFGVSSFY